MILEFVPEAALQAKLVNLLEAAVAYQSSYGVIFCMMTAHNFTVRSTTPQRMNVLHRAILYSGDVAVVKAILHAYPALSFDACSADSGGETFAVSRVGKQRIEMPSMAGYTALAMCLLLNTVDTVEHYVEIIACLIEYHVSSMMCDAGDHMPLTMLLKGNYREKTMEKLIGVFANVYRNQGCLAAIMSDPQQHIPMQTAIKQHLNAKCLIMVYTFTVASLRSISKNTQEMRDKQEYRSDAPFEISALGISVRAGSMPANPNGFLFTTSRYQCAVEKSYPHPCVFVCNAGHHQSDYKYQFYNIQSPALSIRCQKDLMAWHPKLRSDLRCEVLSWVNEEVQACLSNITATTKKNVNDLTDFALFVCKAESHNVESHSGETSFNLSPSQQHEKRQTLRQCESLIKSIMSAQKRMAKKPVSLSAAEMEQRTEQARLNAEQLCEDDAAEKLAIVNKKKRRQKKSASGNGSALVLLVLWRLQVVMVAVMLVLAVMRPQMPMAATVLLSMTVQPSAPTWTSQTQHSAVMLPIAMLLRQA